MGAGGSWTAAANCVAATRAAAASCSTPSPTAPAGYPDAAALAQVALAAADTLTVTQQVSTNPSVAVSFVAGDAVPQPRTANVGQVFVAGDVFPQASPATAGHVFVSGDACLQ